MVAEVADPVGRAAGEPCTLNHFLGSGRRIEQPVIEAFAEDAHLRADLGMPFPDPTWLAVRNGFTLWATMSPPDCCGACAGQTLFYRPGLRRPSGREVYHGFANGLLLRYGEAYGEGDITALSLALMAPWPAVCTILRGRTFKDAARVLIRRHVHAPTILLRARLQQVWMNTPPSPFVRIC